MKITKIYLRTPKQEGKVKAYADVVLEDCFIIHNIRVIQAKEKLIVCMPSRKHKTTFKDIVHPINSEIRKYITDEIVAKYNELNK